MKVVTILGARPQFIKAAVVSRVLQSRAGVVEVLVHTGQHYDPSMSEIFFAELQIPKPAYNLGVGSGPHGAQTGEMLREIETTLEREDPDWVLVYGDTNSTLAGALAAAKLQMAVAHVEAGLRSYNRAMPEEINRVVTDHLANRLFAPTDRAVANLRTEGIPDERIVATGDVMYDATLHFGSRSGRTARLLDGIGIEPGAYVLATVHRAENTDDPGRLAAIFDGLKLLSRDLPVVLPLHPRTAKALPSFREEAAEDFPNLRILEPLGYLDMLTLERTAKCIATDSGGVQKEAFFHRVPCVTLREETEWVELVEAGWNRLCPSGDPMNLVTAVRDAISTVPGEAPPLYGDGHSSERIVDSLLET